MLLTETVLAGAVCIGLKARTKRAAIGIVQGGPAAR
jgi:hypothetical protein